MFTNAILQIKAGRTTMGLPNKDEIKGKFKEGKGAVKETVGRATNDPEMIQEAQDEKSAGRTQETFGKARRKVGDVIKDVGDAIRK
jgi:uncharacterized protein YjbJ (UPF0337 family)